MSQLNDMILQLFFALAPFVIYNIYYRDKLKNCTSTFIIITSSICLLLSMTFASSVVTGVFFDMRYVIMFFGLVFGGVQAGLLLLIEFILYRVYLGGEGKWVGIFIVAITFTISVLFCNIYRTAVRKYIVTFIAGLLFSILPLILTYLMFPQYVTENITFHILVIPVQNSVAIWLLMSLFSKAVSDKELFISHAQNERMEMMSHVAASLAHEVRNPLTAIKGFLKLISERSHDTQKIEQYIRISLDEVQRTESILSEYLSLTKPSARQCEIINYCDQLRVVADVMTPYAIMYNVELEVSKPDIPVLVLANPDELKQVLVNFIKNGVEACSEITCGKIELSLKAEGNNTILLIKDNGVGMNREQIERLGSIYFSTKSSGTGLGLTYSYQVIHALGGLVTVSSKPQLGTRFTITIPSVSAAKHEI
ncbi:ATP-binding protein [Paenibacillus agricola]|uniref:histidine kinase n=1 Tax=Paenibacillus agricola TaxID=2716264 RepID=A0ABX0JIB3_9BACL|nr:ATP-binding protein [Paenibacillus agricola]NHN35185.1 GHKL domain-containing protein [Paenibacillus agricola]